MVLKIDHELCRKVWGEYLFDIDTCRLYEKGSDEAEYLEAPLPFPHISDTEFKTAFIDSLGGKEISERLNRCKSEKEFLSVFWEYTDDGGERYIAYSKFETRYAAEKISAWCGEHNISCYTDKSDKTLMFFINN